MSEEQAALNKELTGNDDSRTCAACGLSKPASELVLVSSETLGHVGGGNADVCLDCYRQIQSGDVEPMGDPEF